MERVVRSFGAAVEVSGVCIRGDQMDLPDLHTNAEILLALWGEGGVGG